MFIEPLKICNILSSSGKIQVNVEVEKVYGMAALCMSHSYNHMFHRCRKRRTGGLSKAPQLYIEGGA